MLFSPAPPLLLDLALNFFFPCVSDLPPFPPDLSPLWLPLFVLGVVANLPAFLLARSGSTCFRHPTGRFPGSMGRFAIVVPVSEDALFLLPFFAGRWGAGAPAGVAGRWRAPLSPSRFAGSVARRPRPPPRVRPNKGTERGTRPHPRTRGRGASPAFNIFLFLN